MNRQAELAANLAAVRRRVEAACSSAGRQAGGVAVVAVTKTFPASDVRLLSGLGVTDVGENRDQEAKDKHAECRDLPLRWHFVGQLQTNKVRSVAAYADVVHSVDRLALVDALSRHAAGFERRIGCCVQVNLDAARRPDRGGAAPADVEGLAVAIADSASLELAGVMAVAPLDADADESFARLAAVADAVRTRHPAAVMVSAGMSADLEAAIRHGATHVRIGTALLGHRAVAFG